MPWKLMNVEGKQLFEDACVGGLTAEEMRADSERLFESAMGDAKLAAKIKKTAKMEEVTIGQTTKVVSGMELDFMSYVEAWLNEAASHTTSEETRRMHEILNLVCCFDAPELTLFESLEVCLNKCNEFIKCGITAKWAQTVKRCAMAISSNWPSMAPLMIHYEEAAWREQSKNLT